MGSDILEAFTDVLDQYNHARKLKNLNKELMEHLSSTIRWVLHYCEKNNIKPPNLDLIQDSIERSNEYIYKIKTPYQPKGNSDNFNLRGNRTLKIEKR